MIAHFILRGPKEVWKMRPIIYMEVFISTLFWFTFVKDFYFCENIAMASRFSTLNTVFWLRNLRAFEFMKELQDY